MQQVASPEFFRTNLRAAMLAKGITQRELAIESETSYPYVNRVLCGLTAPTLPRCEKLADAIGFRLSDLIQSPNKFRSLLLTCRKASVKS